VGRRGPRALLRAPPHEARHIGAIARRSAPSDVALLLQALGRGRSVMPISWSERLSVDVPEIDAQHKELISRVAKLHAAMKAKDRQECGRLIAYLGTYVVEHFSAEERLMEATLYLEATYHRREHKALTDAYVEFKERYDEHGPTALLTLELSETLTDWLKKHILGSDMRMGAHFKAHPKFAAHAHLATIQGTRVAV
jgi:hemerythrin